MLNFSHQLEYQGLLQHGGRVQAAAKQFAIPRDQWLDLSTGINANGWPVRTPPVSAWARLPEEDDELHDAAHAYYDTNLLLPVAGSQAAIQALPQLRAPSRISVLNPGYMEHVNAWKRYQHTVKAVTSKQIDAVLPNTDVLIIINPNNPTGDLFSVSQLLDWHAQLAERGGWMVVDEAYMDTTPEQSVVPYAEKPGLIVLRSLGKFFGLAGARVGFVCANTELLVALNSLLGPWTINTPARWVAIQALRDDQWQRQARQRLKQDSARLKLLLSRHHLTPDGGCAFFHWIQTTEARNLFEALAYQGILIRVFDDPPSVRFGLPCLESEWQRLDSVLAHI